MKNRNCETAGIDCQQISYWELFWTFFRVGLLTLGGGMAMVAVLRHELVLKKKLIRDADFMAELSTATMVPGAIAVNFAYLQGRNLKKSIGALVAILGTILPSIIIILLIALFAMPYFHYPKVEAFFKGCALAVAGQLAFTGYIFIRKHFRDWRNIFVCAVGLLVVAVFRLHPVWTVFITGIIGYFLCRNYFSNTGSKE